MKNNSKSSLLLWNEFIDSKKAENLFLNLYAGKEFNSQKNRYNNLIKNFHKEFKTGIFSVFSSPGRTELVGNHTDHNNGKVIAASINLDSIAAACPNNEMNIKIITEGFTNIINVNLNELEMKINEKGKSPSLVRGIASKMKSLGYKVSGFNAYISSNVARGSGLSSSACFEVLIGSIINHLFNANKIPSLPIAKIGQFAENIYFDKPCGLMDQIACITGGIVSIDFKDKENPVIDKIKIDFKNSGCDLIIVNTGGSHADLTEDYTSIPDEMKKIAKFFNKLTCREIDFKKFEQNFNKLRSLNNDRAILRVIHFLNENIRVQQAVKSLKSNDISSYFKIVKKSGDSSWELLQNCYSPKNLKKQNIPLALALTEKFLNNEGAFRLHGGGFAGTIQAYIPSHKTQSYKKYIEKFFGKDSAIILSIRNTGCIKLF